MTVAAYAEMREAHLCEALIDAERFGAVSDVLGASPSSDNLCTREEAWVHKWRHWGGRVVYLKGTEHVGDMAWVRSRDKRIY